MPIVLRPAAFAAPNTSLMENLALPRRITIDGPAASGKSVLAEVLAARLGYFYFDTGLMYRAVTLEALDRGIPIGDQARVTRLAEAILINVTPPSALELASGCQFHVTVDGHDVSSGLRRADVDRNVSPVSAYPGVRRAMTAQQRRIAERGRIIMTGRDIGTVVLPDAECKIYLTAAEEARAHRRMLDRLARGEHVTMEQMLAEIRQRDAIDSSRTVAPLRPAADAILLDNTALTIEQTVARALEIIADAASSGEYQPVRRN
jgi:cytidylate kinase